jgi:hypothetical protein
MLLFACLSLMLVGEFILGLLYTSAPDTVWTPSDGYSEEFLLFLHKLVLTSPESYTSTTDTG